jgi:hypothetical protein
LMCCHGLYLHREFRLSEEFAHKCYLKDRPTQLG